MRRIVSLALLAALMLALAACAPDSSTPPQRSEPSPVTSAPVTPAARLDEMGPPYSSGVLPEITLAQGLEQMKTRVSLPPAAVAGVPDAVMIGHNKGNPNSIWIHYSNGVSLQVEPAAINVLGMGKYPKPELMKQRHPDGTPYFRFETVAGRRTLISVAGPASEVGYPTAPGDAVSWVHDGYVYWLSPNPPNPASLDTLIAVARSIQ